MSIFVIIIIIIVIIIIIIIIILKLAWKIQAAHFGGGIKMLKLVTRHNISVLLFWQNLATIRRRNILQRLVITFKS